MASFQFRYLVDDQSGANGANADRYIPMILAVIIVYRRLLLNVVT